MKWYILPHGNIYKETIWEVNMGYMPKNWAESTKLKISMPPTPSLTTIQRPGHRVDNCKMYIALDWIYIANLCKWGSYILQWNVDLSTGKMCLM